MELIVKGGILMIPILLCSVVALAIILERLIRYHRVRKDNELFLNRIRGRIRPDRLDEATRVCEDDPSPLASIFLEGLKHLNLGEQRTREAIVEAGEREAQFLERNLEPDETLLIAPGAPGLYPMLPRPCPIWDPFPIHPADASILELRDRLPLSLREPESKQLRLHALLRGQERAAEGDEIPRRDLMIPVQRIAADVEQGCAPAGEPRRIDFFREQIIERGRSGGAREGGGLRDRAPQGEKARREGILERTITEFP